MNKEIISEALNYIDDSLLEQTDKLRTAPRSKKIVSIKWAKYASIAAAAAVVIMVGSVTIGNLVNGPQNSMKAESTNTIMMADKSEYAMESESISDIKTAATTTNPDRYMSIADSTFTAGDMEDGLSAESKLDYEDCSNGLEAAPAANGDSVNSVKEAEMTIGSLSGNVVTSQCQVVCKVMEANSDVVKVLIINNSKETISTGSEYELEMLKGNNWYSVTLGENVGFDLIAYSIEAGADREFTFEPSKSFGNLIEGKYRIIQKFAVGDTSSSNFDDVTTGAEFEIK